MTINYQRFLYNKIAFIVFASIIIFAMFSPASSPAKANDGTLPDFAIESLVLNDRDVSYTLRNNGLAFSGSAMFRYVWLNRSGAAVSTLSETASITVDSSGSISRTYRTAAIPATAFRLQVTVDPLNSIEELSNDNNTATVDRPLPDLTIVSPVFTDENSVRYTISNIGTARYSGSSVAEFRWLNASGAAVGSAVLQSISIDLFGGATIELTRDFTTVPSGAVSLRISVDPSNTILEPIDSNNSATAVIPIPQPDFSLESPILNFPGGSFVLRNTGDAWSGAVLADFILLDASGTQVGSDPYGLTFTTTLGADESMTRLFTYLAAAPASATRMRIIIDPDNEITEASETNNSIDIDLVRVELSLEAASIAGNTLTYTVRNSGPGTFVGNAPLRYRFVNSYDVQVNLRTDSFPVALASGETAVHSYTFSPVPPATAVRLQLIIDNNNSIPETDETNNTTEVVWPRPDLIPQNLVYANGDLQFDIRNEGGQDYSGPVYIRYEWLEDDGTALINTFQIPTFTIPAGGTVSHTRDIGTTPVVGTVSIRVSLDPNNIIPELNDSNNSASIAFTYPDFVAESTDLDDETLTYSIRNAGDSAYNGPLLVRFWWVRGDGVLLTPYITDSLTVDLAPGSSIAQSHIFSSVPAAAARLRILVDPTNAIYEAGTGANEVFVDYDNLPDLTVESAELEDGLVRYSVHNHGDASWSGTVQIRHEWLLADGTASGYLVASPNITVPASGSVERTRTFSSVPGGSVQMHIKVDSMNAAFESHEDNNTALVDFPDFVAQGLDLDGNYLTYTVVNNGPAAYAGSLPVRFEWLRANGTRVGTIINGTISIDLADDASFSANRTFTSIPSTAGYLRVTVDPMNSIPEGSNTNNMATIPLPVPDLLIDDVSVSGNVVRYTVRNAGENSWSGPTLIRHHKLDASGESTMYSGTTPTLTIGAGDEVDREFTFSGSMTGVARVRVVVDPSNSIVESNNDNNSAEGNVLLPDLSIDNAVLNGSNVTFTVHNNGEIAYSGSVRFYFEWLSTANGIISVASTDQTVDISALGTDSVSYTFSIVPVAAAQLRLRADVNNMISEVNETNNTFSVVVTPPEEEPAPAPSEPPPPPAPVPEPAPAEPPPAPIPSEPPPPAPIKTIEPAPVIIKTVEPAPIIKTTEPAPAPAPAPVVKVVALPDLVIESPVVGATALTYSLRNAGTGAAKGTISARYSWLKSDGSLISSSNESVSISLAAGASTARTFSYKAKPTGAATLRIEIDITNVIAESNEGSNSFDVKVGK